MRRTDGRYHWIAMLHNSHGDTRANNIVGSAGQGEGSFEIGQILHLKFETRNLRMDVQTPKASADWAVQFEISSFEFEMQDSSNFKIPLSRVCKYVVTDISFGGQYSRYVWNLCLGTARVRPL
jgi:hypothetical protein